MQSLKIREWWWVVPFAGIRLWLAMSFPIFNDESIYALWARLIGANFNRGLWPILMDGKQPGLMIFWSTIVGIGNDPVWIIRLSSIGFGLITAIIIFRMYRLITGRKILWWQQLIYLMIPGLVWYESMGLQESAVVLIGSAIVYWAVLRFFNHDWGTKQGIVLGAILSFGILTKPTALLTLGSVILTALFENNYKKVLLPLVIAVCMCILSSQLIRFHQGYLAYYQRSQQRSSINLVALPQRLFDVGQWLLWWVGPIGFVGFITIHKIKKASYLILVGILGVLVGSLAAGQGIFTSRYIAASYPLLVLSGLLVLKNRLAVLIGMWSAITLLIISYPFTALTMMKGLPAVGADFSQYVTGWPSGWGVKEAIHRVASEIGDRRGIVLTRADSGNPESAVGAYLWGNQHIQVANTVNAKVIIDKKLSGELVDVPIYFISRGNQFADLPIDRLRIVAKYIKPLDSEFVAVYELK